MAQKSLTPPPILSWYEWSAWVSDREWEWVSESEWVREWVSERVSEQMSALVCEWVSKLSEWESEWVSEWLWFEIIWRKKMSRFTCRFNIKSMCWCWCVAVLLMGWSVDVWLCCWCVYVPLIVLMVCSMCWGWCVDDNACRCVDVMCGILWPLIVNCLCVF